MMLITCGSSLRMQKIIQIKKQHSAFIVGGQEPCIYSKSVTADLTDTKVL